MTEANTAPWEYATLVHEVDGKALMKEAHADGLTSVLNDRGSEGWELVDAAPIAIASNLNMNNQTRGLLLVFKRPRG
jgi:hypothetical protein